MPNTTQKHYKVIDINDNNYEYECESAEEVKDIIMDILDNLAKGEAAVLDIRVEGETNDG